MSSMGLAAVMSDPLIRPISSAPSPRAVLLAFPHAGGGARLFRPTLRAGYEVLESWCPRPSPIDVPIIEIHGADDHSLGGGVMAGRREIRVMRTGGAPRRRALSAPSGGPAPGGPAPGSRRGSGQGNEDRSGKEGWT